MPAGTLEQIIFRMDALQRIEKSGMKALNESERSRLLALPFRYIKGRHRLDLTEGSSEEEFESRIDQLVERGALPVGVMHVRYPDCRWPYVPVPRDVCRYQAAA